MIKKIAVAFLSLVFTFSFISPGLADTVQRPSYFLIEGHLLVQTISNINSLLTPLKLKRNPGLEKKLGDQYVRYLIVNTSNLNQYVKPLVFFVTYGTPSSMKLKPAERSGILAAYQLAYGKLPILESDWADVIRISKGVKPENLSLQAEQRAKPEFRKAYGREAVLAGDQTALNIIAYGLYP